VGTDPILTDVPLVVPAGTIICLSALTVTAWPILVGERVSDRRRRQAVWGSWACLAGVVVAMFTGLIPGLYGFFTLAAIAAVAAATLLRRRERLNR
jgi:predicted benzoate:H+ symporter BenE